MQTTVRVAVVGAGAAGLCALRHLTSIESGGVQFDVTCFEKSCRVGGTWFYTELVGQDENGLPVHSSMYKNLRTNLPVQCMAFPDFPFQSGLPSFVEHDVVQKYLEDYATNFELYKHIKFLTSVKWIQPITSADDSNKVTWEVTTVDVVKKLDNQPEIFDAVLLCNGHYATPVVPDIAGLSTFTGQVLHSHDYRHPEGFAGKSVLIMGAGASGQDIGIELSSVAKQIYLSHAKTPLTARLPDNLIQKPRVTGICGPSAQFADGSQAEVEAVIFCTGYHYDFNFLSPRCGVRVDDGRVTPLFKHMLNTKFPTMAFIGICKLILPFPMFDVQVRFFRSVLEGKCVLPNEDSMNEDTVLDFRKRLDEGLPHRYAHTMGARQFAYNDELADLGSVERLPAYFSKVYQRCHLLRAEDLVTYKNCTFLVNESGDDCCVVR